MRSSRAQCTPASGRVRRGLLLHPPLTARAVVASRTRLQGTSIPSGSQVVWGSRTMAGAVCWSNSQGEDPKTLIYNRTWLCLWDSRTPSCPAVLPFVAFLQDSTARAGTAVSLVPMQRTTRGAQTPGSACAIVMRASWLGPATCRHERPSWPLGARGPAGVLCGT